jgi:hypothetical protein
MRSEHVLRPERYHYGTRNRYHATTSPALTDASSAPRAYHSP